VIGGNKREAANRVDGAKTATIQVQNEAARP